MNEVPDNGLWNIFIMSVQSGVLLVGGRQDTRDATYAGGPRKGARSTLNIRVRSPLPP